MWYRCPNKIPSYKSSTPDGPVLYQVYTVDDRNDFVRVSDQTTDKASLPPECHAAIALLDAVAEGPTSILYTQVLAEIVGVGEIQHIYKINNRDYHIFESFLKKEEHCGESNAVPERKLPP